MAQEQATTYAGLVEGDTYQWEGTRQDSNGNSQPTAFAFSVEANGSVHFQGAGNTTVSGVIVGDKITLTVEFGEGNAMLNFEGRIEGETMSGGFSEGDKSG